jgi:VIT1/CCC1 family predicted Fe2+/Mn2+ transporter
MSRQQQQQQFADYDLLAVFNDETRAEAAETKLHKEGFSSEEVFRLAASMVKGGEFREHGPNRNRSSVFLQTRRTGPNPVLVVLLAVVFGLILGLLLFVAHFAFAAIPEPTAAIAGVVVGVILGVVIGLLQRGRVQGAIGQDMSKVSTTSRQPAKDDLKVVAIRLPDPSNITRKSRARAILLTNGGKIDRSVSRRE